MATSNFTVTDEQRVSTLEQENANLKPRVAKNEADILLLDKTNYLNDISSNFVSDGFVATKSSTTMEVSFAKDTYARNRVYIAGKSVTIPDQTVTIEAADASLTRIDLLVASTGGSVLVLKGTAGSGQGDYSQLTDKMIVLYELSIPATVTNLSTATLTDKRVWYGHGPVMPSDYVAGKTFQLTATDGSYSAGVYLRLADESWSPIVVSGGIDDHGTYLSMFDKFTVNNIAGGVGGFGYNAYHDPVAGYCKYIASGRGAVGWQYNNDGELLLKSAAIGTSGNQVLWNNAISVSAAGFVTIPAGTIATASSATTAGTASDLAENSILSVGKGGTGASSFTSGYIPYYNGSALVDSSIRHDSNGITLQEANAGDKRIGVVEVTSGNAYGVDFKQVSNSVGCLRSYDGGWKEVLKWASNYNVWIPSGNLGIGTTPITSPMARDRSVSVSHSSGMPSYILNTQNVVYSNPTWELMMGDEGAGKSFFALCNGTDQRLAVSSSGTLRLPSVGYADAGGTHTSAVIPKFYIGVDGENNYSYLSEFRLYTQANSYTKDSSRLILRSWDESTGESPDLFTFKGDGSLGIGTTPTEKLDVAGNINFTGALKQNGTEIFDAAGTLNIRDGNGAGSYGLNQVTLAYNTSGQYRHAIKTRHHSSNSGGNAIDFFLWTTADDSNAVGTHHAMSVSYLGVGIGGAPTNTTQTLRTLEVVGNTYTSVVCRNTLSDEISITSNHSGNNLFSSNTFKLLVNSSTTVVLFADLSGNLGIGTTSPSEKLDVAGNIQMQKAGTASDIYGALIWKSPDISANYRFALMNEENGVGGCSLVIKHNGGTERFRIDNSGNVGIGTATPTEKLDVAGNINFSGTLKRNGVDILDSYDNSTQNLIESETDYLDTMSVNIPTTSFLSSFTKFTDDVYFLGGLNTSDTTNDVRLFVYKYGLNITTEITLNVNRPVIARNYTGNASEYDGKVLAVSGHAWNGNSVYSVIDSRNGYSVSNYSFSASESSASLINGKGVQIGSKCLHSITYLSGATVPGCKFLEIDLSDGSYTFHNITTAINTALGSTADDKIQEMFGSKRTNIIYTTHWDGTTIHIAEINYSTNTVVSTKSVSSMTGVTGYHSGLETEDHIYLFPHAASGGTGDILIARIDKSIPLSDATSWNYFSFSPEGSAGADRATMSYSLFKPIYYRGSFTGRFVASYTAKVGATKVLGLIVDVFGKKYYTYSFKNSSIVATMSDSTNDKMLQSDIAVMDNGQFIAIVSYQDVSELAYNNAQLRKRQKLFFERPVKLT